MIRYSPKQLENCDPPNACAHATYKSRTLWCLSPHFSSTDHADICALLLLRKTSRDCPPSPCFCILYTLCMKWFPARYLPTQGAVPHPTFPPLSQRRKRDIVSVELELQMVQMRLKHESRSVAEGGLDAEARQAKQRAATTTHSVCIYKTQRSRSLEVELICLVVAAS